MSFTRFQYITTAMQLKYKPWLWFVWFFDFAMLGVSNLARNLSISRKDEILQYCLDTSNINSYKSYIWRIRWQKEAKILPWLSHELQGKFSQDKRREEERRYARPQRHLGNSFPVRFQQKITTGLQGQRNMGSIVPKEEIYVNWKIQCFTRQK